MKHYVILGATDDSAVEPAVRPLAAFEHVGRDVFAEDWRES